MAQARPKLESCPPVRGDVRSQAFFESPGFAEEGILDERTGCQRINTRWYEMVHGLRAVT